MALVEPVFLDTSILLGGLIEMGPSTIHSQNILDAVADGRVQPPHTAWHCCLEFYAVATRLPPQFRLSPADAVHLLEAEILDRCQIHQLSSRAYRAFLRETQKERAAGGRVYDAHIAEIARLSGCRTVLTENRRHFTVLLRHGLRVLTAEEGADEI